MKLVDDWGSPAKRALVHVLEDPAIRALPLTTGLYDDSMGLRRLPDGHWVILVRSEAASVVLTRGAH